MEREQAFLQLGQVDSCYMCNINPLYTALLLSGERSKFTVLVGEKRCVTTQITAAEETIDKTRFILLKNGFII